VKRSKKQQAALWRRIAAWDALNAVDISASTKRVRIDKAGMGVFHKPGSQNAHKGLGRRKKQRR